MLGVAPSLSGPGHSLAAGIRTDKPGMQQGWASAPENAVVARRATVVGGRVAGMSLLL